MADTKKQTQFLLNHKKDFFEKKKGIYECSNIRCHAKKEWNYRSEEEIPCGTCGGTMRLKFS